MARDDPETLPENLIGARIKLGIKRPYINHALWALTPVAKPGLGTVAVDKWWRLYYDPEVIQTKWTADALAGALYHEIGHLLRDHPWRCEAMQAQPQVFNIAGDAEINDDIVAEENKLTLPDNPVLPSTFGCKEGDYAEAYYEHLMKHAKVIKVHGPAGGKCGSAAGGPSEGYEDPAPSKSGDGTRGVTKGEAELIRQQVAQSVKEHERSRGTVPAWMTRWADELLHPKIPWRRVLASWIRRGLNDALIGLVNPSYRRPSRRQGASPCVLLPSWRKPTPRAAIIVDTSGSMGERELALGLAEVDGVLQACNCAVTVLSVDAAVHTVKKVTSRREVQLVGGGGTDMTVGITAACELMPRPHVVICITDGFTPWPAAPPAIPLIIVLVADGKYGGGAPEWAKVVRVDDTVPAGKAS